jgi:hypothetical protein
MGFRGRYVSGVMGAAMTAVNIVKARIAKKRILR